MCVFIVLSSFIFGASVLPLPSGSLGFCMVLGKMRAKPKPPMMRQGAQNGAQEGNSGEGPLQELRTFSVR